MKTLELSHLNVSELSMQQSKSTDGGSIALLAAIEIVAFCYGAGYAIGNAIGHALN